MTVRMLAYNGSIPGPTLRVQQGSKLVVHAVNEGDLEATVIGTACASRTDTTVRTKRRHRSQSAEASPTGSNFPTQVSTGTTRTFVRTTPRRWGSTGTSSSSPPTASTGRRSGRWMAHCHIAEHHESGMMFSFDVEP